MKLVDLLPAQNSAPDQCRECDGPLLHTDGAECRECDGAGLVQRLEWRYQNGEGITPLGVFAGVEFVREFHPLNASFGVEFRLGSEWYLAVSLGLWMLVARRDL